MGSSTEIGARNEATVEGGAEEEVGIAAGPAPCYQACHTSRSS